MVIKQQIRPYSPYCGTPEDERWRTIPMRVRPRVVSTEQRVRTQLALEAEHLSWGHGFEAVDLDYLIVEYRAWPTIQLAGFFELKREGTSFDVSAARQPSGIRALIDVGNRADLPFWVVVYAKDFSWWIWHAMNRVAHACEVPTGSRLTKAVHQGAVLALKGVGEQDLRVLEYRAWLEGTRQRLWTPSKPDFDLSDEPDFDPDWTVDIRIVNGVPKIWYRPRSA